MNLDKAISKSLYSLSSGYKIPAIGLGTWKIDNSKSVNDAVKYAYDAGYRHLDSAVCYNNEKLIGDALKKWNIPREEMFITTKIPNSGMQYDLAVGHINKSLENFQTNYIDLVLIHWPGAKTVEDRIGVWKALEEGVESGKIRTIGVSNFLPIHLKTILDVCKIKPAVNQIELHPMYIHTETIDLCKKENILIEAYSTFARMDPKLIKNEVLVKISTKYKKKPTQVLVRWALQCGFVILPKSSNKERINENLDIDDFVLTDEELKELNSLNCGYKITWDPATIKF